MAQVDATAEACDAAPSQPTESAAATEATDAAPAQPKEPTAAAEAADAAPAQPTESAAPEEATDAAPAQPKEPTAAAEAADAAPAQPTESVAPEQASSQAVTLAGRKCSSRAEIADHIKSIQESLQDSDGNIVAEGILSPKDAFFVFHLVLHHPKAIAKMTSPVLKIRYGTYAKFHNKCFILMCKDGTEEGVSWAKSADAIFPKKPSKTEGSDSTAPAPTVQTETLRGCSLDIHGVPATFSYFRLRDLLGAFGKVHFLKTQWNEPSWKKRKVGSEAAEEGSEKADDSGVSAKTNGGVSLDKAGGEESVVNDAPETTFARCCVTEPAAAARIAKEFTELGGVKVQVSMVTGSDEDAFLTYLAKRREGHAGRGEAKGHGRGKHKRTGDR